MPLKEIKRFCDLYQVIESKKKEIISVSEIKTIFYKYGIYHKCKGHQYQNRNRFPFAQSRKDHKILYFVLEKLYMAKSSDLCLISAVIKRIYEEGIRFNHLISDIFNESKNFETDEIIQMLEYCLKYAYMQKMVFNGFRLATLKHFFPIMYLPDSNYTSCLPKIIGILLRYGMLLDPVTGEGPTLVKILPALGRFDTNVGLWYSILNEGFLRYNPQLLPVNLLPNKRKEIVNLSMEVANLLVRDSLKFKLSVFTFSIRMRRLFTKCEDLTNSTEYLNELGIDADLRKLSDSEHNTENRKSLLKFENEIKFVEELGRFIPGLPKRCLEPTSLKHCCKQLIRKLLHLNWQLPNGIYNLDLPTLLTRYLNLEID